jgi:hypothetical protein
MSQKIYTNLDIKGNATIGDIANATSDTDKFLVSDAGVVKYRTGSEMLSDLGVAPGVASNVQHQVKAGVAINKGQAVYVTSADGTNMIVGLASNASEATSSKTMGLLDNTVAINGFANVVTEGLLSGLNTIVAADGDPVWLGTNGNLIYGLANKPSAPDHLVFIGIVTRVNANNGEIFVKVQNGFELNEIHDVDLKSSTPIGNQILAFEGAPVNLWRNKTIPSVLGYTPVPTSRTITINGNTQDLSANLSFNIASGVTSFNTRTGAITLTSGDVTGALGYTPYNASNPAGYISSYTETDPTVPSHVKAITTTNISNWNTAFGWGNHASAGYVPGARTITINGTTQDLSANRSFTVTAVEVDTLATVTARGALSTGNIFTPVNGGVFFNGNGLYGSGVYGSGNDLWFNAGSTQKAALNSSGDFTANNSVRSPIFYDSNNTAYYLNPSGSSIFGGGDQYVLRLEHTATQGDFVDAFYVQNNESGGRVQIGMSANGSDGQHHRVSLRAYKGSGNLEGTFGIALRQPSTAHVQRLTLTSPGDLTVDSSMRTPIFYDSNDTSYYADLNSTSDSAIRVRGGMLMGPNPTWGAYLQVGGNGNNTNYATVATTDGNLHLDGAVGSSMYLNYYHNGAIYLNGSTYSISSNGSYYNGTSASANSVSWGNVSSKPSYIMYYQGFTLDANTMDSNATGFTYAVNAPYVGPIAKFSTGGGYDLQINANYGGSGSAIAYRTRNGDIGSNNPWYRLYSDAYRPYADNSGTVGGYSVSVGGSANTIPTRNGSGYLIPENWIQLNGAYGLYSPTNNAHLRPNNASYGPWYVIGSRNGWGGIEFESGNGNPTLMISGDSNTVGFHNNSYGWQIRWANGLLYSGRNSYGGNDSAVLQEDKWIGSKYFGSDGAIYGTVFYDANDGGRFVDLSSTGDSIRASGDIVAFYSDERLKDRQGNIQNALDKVLSLNGFHYTPNARAQELGYKYKEEVGVSAQEVEAILPQLIKDAPIGHGYKTLDYGKLTPLLIEAIKEQQTQIEELKELVNKLINK